MYDNLQLWFRLIHRFVSQTAFIEDDRVYIKEGGIVQIPVFDPETVMMFMNDHPHLLEDLYAEWRTTGDDPSWSVQREFSIILFEDMLEQDAMAEKLKAVPQMSAEMENAMAQILGALANMGIGVINETGNPKFDIVASR